MVIFHSFVCLPEGRCVSSRWSCAGAKFGRPGDASPTGRYRDGSEGWGAGKMRWMDLENQETMGDFHGISLWNNGDIIWYHVFFVLENRCVYIYNIILYIILYNTHDDLAGVLLNRCSIWVPEWWSRWRGEVAKWQDKSWDLGTSTTTLT